jgi:CRP-like cAMP-binding protein
MAHVPAGPSSRIFAGLTELARGEILAAGRPRQLQARELLAEQDEPATTFYVVQVGHLKLSKLSPDGREIIARFVGPGDPFAGIVVLGHPTYPLTARAVEPTRVLAWTKPVLLELAGRYPQLRTNILEEITRHMTEALDRVQELSTERVSQRVARTLLRLAEHGGRPAGAGIEIAHPITRQELADLTGATLFTVSRLLARWEERRIIESGKGQIAILDTTELQALTEVEEEE